MSIGEALAEARGQAGLTVTQVSQRTRIRETIITGIESDDYSACGGDFYARGHIRAIAKVVGTDPEPLIRAYDTARLPPPDDEQYETSRWPRSGAEYDTARQPPGGSEYDTSRWAPDSAEYGTARQSPDDSEYGTSRWAPDGAEYGTARQPPDSADYDTDPHAEVVAEYGAPWAARDSADYRPPWTARDGADYGRPPAAPSSAGHDTARRPLGGLREEATRPAAPLRTLRTGRRRARYAAAVLGLALVAVLGFLGYRLAAGSSHTSGTAQPGASHPVSHHPAATVTPTQTPTPRTSTPAAPPVRALAPASATAFGIRGAGQGDDPGGARLAIDGRPATAWHTDWYTTAHFGNLYSGTGLLVDMGRPVTVTAAQIALGGARGASFELRIGDAPALAALRLAATATGAAGLVRVPLATPARGRYVLIWFTSLPPDPAGTFQASVYEMRLEGRP